MRASVRPLLPTRVAAHPHSLSRQLSQRRPVALCFSARSRRPAGNGPVGCRLVACDAERASGRRLRWRGGSEPAQRLTGSGGARRRRRVVVDQGRLIRCHRLTVAERVVGRGVVPGPADLRACSPGQRWDLPATARARGGRRRRTFLPSSAGNAALCISSRSSSRRSCISAAGEKLPSPPRSCSSDAGDGALRRGGALAIWLRARGRGTGVVRDQQSRPLG